MFNISSVKVLIPSLLFYVLNMMGDQKNITYQKVFVDSLIFIVMYKIVAELLGVYLVPRDLLMGALLAFILSPGLILSLQTKGDNVVFFQGQRNMDSILIHTVIYTVIISIVKK